MNKKEYKAIDKAAEEFRTNRWGAGDPTMALVGITTRNPADPNSALVWSLRGHTVQSAQDGKDCHPGGCVGIYEVGISVFVDKDGDGRYIEFSKDQVLAYHWEKIK